MPRTKVIRLILLHFLFSWGSLNAQEFSYRFYGVPDGLVQSQVMCLFQDSKGFLWIGTKGGVSCFDGACFKNFTENDGLVNNLILFIAEDPGGKIWFCSRRGVSSWDGRLLESFPFNLAGSSASIFGMNATGRDSIMVWVCTDQTYLKTIRVCSGKIQGPELFRPMVSLNDVTPWLSKLHQSATATDFFASGKTELYRARKNSFDTIPLPGRVISMFEGRDNHIYLWIEKSIYRLEGERVTMLFNIERPHEFRTNTLAADSRGIFYYYDEHPFLQVTDGNRTIRDGFRFAALDCFYIDRQDNLWIGTETGLYRLKSRDFLNFIPGKCGINQYIWSVAEDRQGRIWFASYTEGLTCWDGTAFHKEVAYLPLVENLYDNFYMGSRVDRSGNILFTHVIQGILKYDGSRFTTPIPDRFRQTVLYIFEDPVEQVILAGANHGYFTIPENGEPVFTPLLPGGNKNHSVVSVARDRNGIYWMGGFDGISLVDHGRIIHLPDKDHPFDQGAIAMVTDPRGNLWIGNKKGLYCYDYSKFTPVDLPGGKMMVAALAMVGDSGLLVGTSKGIAWLDLNRYYGGESPLLHYFDKDNGFEGIEVGQNGFFRDSKGFYWIPASDRVVRFDPRSISKRKHDIPISLADISVLSEKMEWDVQDTGRFNTGEGIRFSHTQKNLRFRFVGIDLTCPERVTYTHMLEGYDHGWSDRENRREAVYTNLPPGKYKFRLRAYDDDGNRTTHETDFSFRIVPAFWQTWWFWTLVLGLAAAGFFLLGYLLMNRRKRAMQERLETEKRIAELQLLSIYNQIDPHFTFNAMNSIASVVLKEEKEKAYRFFVKLSSLIRQVLTSGDRLTRTLSEELVFVQNYLEIEKLRFRDTFEFEIDVRQPVDLDREVPKMVIQTYVENAMKHGLLNKTGGTGRLEIKVWDEAGDLHIEVGDNGIGREQAAKLRMAGTGKGLMLQHFYYDFFDRYNRQKILHDITDLFGDDGEPAGTRVTVIIPAGFRYTIKDHEKT